MNVSGVKAIFDVILSQITQVKRLTEADLALVSSILDDCLSGRRPFDVCGPMMTRVIGSPEPMKRLRSILDVRGRPIPNPAPLESGGTSRRKSRQWMAYEDHRLLAGIYQLGTDNWVAIARFVGNGRTRSQCYQRWTRGLDPRITKERWTPEEEERLVNLVATHGRRSWMKVSHELGNRSDVQCRYRYERVIMRRPKTRTEAVPMLYSSSQTLIEQTVVGKLSDLGA
jgi:hypothetical protein